MIEPDDTSDVDPETLAAYAAKAKAETELREHQAVTEAENTIAKTRHAELVAADQAAARRIPAARGRLTRAHKTSDPDKIATAEQHFDDVWSAYRQAHRKLVDEGFPLVEAMNERAHKAFTLIGEETRADTVILRAGYPLEKKAAGLNPEA